MEQLPGFLETIADAAGQGGQLFGSRGEAARGDAGLLVEGEEALATAAAVVVSTPAGDVAAEADQGALPLAVVRCGVVAVGAG